MDWMIEQDGVTVELILEPTETTYGMYGMKRKEYLREMEPGTFEVLLIQDRLEAHCAMIDEQAREMEESIISRMMVTEGITEELKTQNQMEWIRRINMIRAQAQEIVLTEIIQKELLLN